MTEQQYSPRRAGVRFGIAAVATALVGLLGGWSVRSAVRRGAVAGAAVAAGDYALHRMLGNLPELEAELDERAEEIEVEIEDAATED